MILKIIWLQKSTKAHYYISGIVQIQYYNKNKKLVSYSCTACVDKHDTNENIISQLQVLSEQYLLHHFFAVNDKCYWEKFLGKTEHLTLWLDYSQNIAFNQKKHVQSAHFSGRQHNLHNTIIQRKEKGALVLHSDNCQEQF